MEYKEIRQKYLIFMKEKEHSIIVNASLVPENDPTILFTPAGMSPIVPYLLGETHPQGKRIANVQRCIRTVDIDEVGDRHHLTWFEMAGNWSLNDYFKKEAIAWTFEFLVEQLEFKPEDIYVSVFSGDKDAPKDEVSIEAWKQAFAKYGIEAKTGFEERIHLFDKSECWWEIPSGGPCGPCSESFLNTGKEKCGDDCNVATCNCGRYIEVCNNVFMEFLKKPDGTYEKLGAHNVDFGAGLARWAMLKQGVDHVMEIDINKPIFDKVGELASESNLKSQIIVSEHINAATFILMDEVVPSNTEQGYVLRRIIRRAIRHARQLGIPTPFVGEIAKVAIKQYGELYPQLVEKQDLILEELGKEEKKFAATVAKGEKELRKYLSTFRVKKGSEEKISWTQLLDGGKYLFTIYETYGYPLELSLEIIKEYATSEGSTLLEPDEQRFKDEFREALKAHQEKSRAGATDKFKGGLADTSEMSTKYHTATHLLNAALREVLGDHVYQKGSNITPERLRFDYPNPAKLTPEQVKEVEDWVNDKIEQGLEITWEEMTPEKAKELSVVGVFGHRYGDVVKVYAIGDKDSPVSKEICGGPHVSNTKELGTFRIKKQDNVGAGVKRIKAVLE